MSSKVKLKDIVDELSVQFDDYQSYLNLKTGEIISVPISELGRAEELDSLDELSEWEQEELKDAFDIIENEDNYVMFPTKYDIHEYRIVEDFCYSVEDNTKRSSLLNAIQGSGAFRRFKNQLNIFHMELEWYSFRDGRYKEIAIEWCKDYGIEYEE